MAFRAVPNTVTGIAPIQLATGRVGNYPYRTLLLPLDPKGKHTRLMCRFPQIMSNIETFQRIAVHNLQQAYNRQKAYWEKHHKPPLLLEIGQTVLLRDRRPLKGVTKKLRCPHYPNVFQIIQSWPEKNIYKLRDTETGKEVKGWHNGANLTVFKPWEGPDAYEELISNYIPKADRAPPEGDTSERAATTSSPAGTSSETVGYNIDEDSQRSETDQGEFEGDLDLEAPSTLDALLDEPLATRREKRATASQKPARYLD